MARKRRDSDIDIFKKDLREFGLSAAGHIPGLGQALAIRDTYLKGKKLAGSTKKTLKGVRRRAKPRIKGTARKRSYRSG